jgi:hypothetical protein
MKKIFLYTTLGCHLCEQAKQVAWPVLEHYGYRLVEVEIADDDALVEAYGVRIPVMKKEHAEQEIGWPFDQEQLAEYIEK